MRVIGAKEREDAGQNGLSLWVEGVDGGASVEEGWLGGGLVWKRNGGLVGRMVGRWDGGTVGGKEGREDSADRRCVGWVVFWVLEVASVLFCAVMGTCTLRSVRWRRPVVKHEDPSWEGE